MTKSRTIFIAMELLNVSYIMKTFEISSKLFAYRHTYTCRYTWFIRKNDSTIDNALKLLTTRRNVLTMRISSLADVMIARISIQWFQNRNYWYIGVSIAPTIIVLVYFIYPWSFSCSVWTGHHNLQSKDFNTLGNYLKGWSCHQEYHIYP